MRTLVVLIALLAYNAAVRTVKLDCPKTDTITKQEMDDAVFVAKVKVETKGAEGSGDTRGTYTDYVLYNLKYEKILYSYYEWFSELTIIRGAPTTLKINKRCNITLDKGVDYVLGSKMYEEPKFNFVKPLINVTESEWRLINKTKD
ncbi:hypothetical protein Aduo_009376 [Ancylostoma duodenale]